MKEAGKASFIVAGWSYGQGSSREHAAICPMYLGVRAVLALSIERIHQANLCNFGILPLTIQDESDYEALNQGDELEIRCVHAQVKAALEGRPFVVHDLTTGKDYSLKLEVTAKQADALLKGGRLNQVKEALK